MGDDVLAHYETGAYARNSTFLGDEEYGRALDVLVKGCADVLLQDDTTGEILLMKRKVQPQPDWWFIGGRMRAGDTPEGAARRNLKRETGLDVPEGRFVPLATTSIAWQKRKQAPEGNGTADIALAFLARVTADERAASMRALDYDEYSGCQWVDPLDVIKGAAYHPALRRAVQHIQVRDAYAALEAALESNAGEAAVAAAAAAYVARMREARAIGGLPAPFVDLPAAGGAGAAAGAGERAGTPAAAGAAEAAGGASPAGAD